MQIVNFYRQQNAFIITWLLQLYEVKSQGLYSLIQLNLIQIPGYIYIYNNWWTDSDQQIEQTCLVPFDETWYDPAIPIKCCGNH